MESKDTLQEFTLDDIFGDAVLESARNIYDAYWENPAAFESNLAVTFQKELVDDAMDMINHRTAQKNDARYMSYVLEWALTGSDLAHQLRVDPSKIKLHRKMEFVQLDYLITQSHSASPDFDVNIWENFTPGMYEEAFRELIQNFEE